MGQHAGLCECDLLLRIKISERRLDVWFEIIKADG